MVIDADLQKSVMQRKLERCRYLLGRIANALLQEVDEIRRAQLP